MDEEEVKQDAQDWLEEPTEKGDDFFNGFIKDYKPEEIKDEGDFKPLKGSYLVRVAKLTHNIGVSERDGRAYDFYSLNMQITETVDGDKGTNRYLNKRYQNTNDGLKKLLNDLFTAGIPVETGSREALDLSLGNAIDKQMRVRAWAWKPEKNMQTGEIIPEEERIAIQTVKIVKDFKSKSKTPSSEIPF